MTDRSLSIVILAAGKGTRMYSRQPKVLHQIAGRSMLGHVLALASGISHAKISVVIGPGMDDVRKEVVRWSPDASIFVQENQAGTADAVLAARDQLVAERGDVIVLYADSPLMRPQTLAKLVSSLESGAGVSVVGFEADDPTGYGRLLTDKSGDLIAIREDKDASADELNVKLCNSGVMAFRLPDVVAVLDRIGNDNAKGEFYLTDAVEIARRDGLKAAVVTCEMDEVLGVNSRDQLAVAESIWQARARLAAMRAGVTMIAPDTVWLSFDTVLGQDVTIEPNVFIGPGVTVGEGVRIKANSYLEGADRKSAAGLRIDTGAEVGPFARLRPGTELGADVHIGNFVEVKNAVLAPGAKANHLTYIGDGTVGAGANIGAGTIFCNYDGFNKNRCEVGAGVFIGSNSALVAPVRIGDGAYVAAGSVITTNVEPDSLAIVRAKREDRPEWAAKYRAMMQRRKG
ncbi:bifunctional UDP-N-acetylglucosamine pyrophosphorylase / Glucosamine-1-phosphate N-acetyltransferase [Filomicrobium insigne]|uniref:Bifunctional protein GlmU n=1 Tax=Filomicrobium insigne TaxID=418854 RepID=A0A1H0TBW5_9HYPH|nr:bifunctional UDP-N-acetylglucosamine diphosphorylase/glucosamine-1-phosphate N-acetyltransferase GlmU [Filomicrobium insigne]SDP50996.1 bifunctional UDP-N-acetylglucosamine pyrophosphorylase / Glucosamine-1-phosphate N-acetyltransferase [Filomicrobium insigne]